MTAKEATKKKNDEKEEEKKKGVSTFAQVAHRGREENSHGRVAAGSHWEEREVSQESQRGETGLCLVAPLLLEMHISRIASGILYVKHPNRKPTRRHYTMHFVWLIHKESKQRR